jgi:hypothetical protein
MVMAYATAGSFLVSVLMQITGAETDIETASGPGSAQSLTTARARVGESRLPSNKVEARAVPSSSDLRSAKVSRVRMAGVREGGGVATPRFA